MSIEDLDDAWYLPQIDAMIEKDAVIPSFLIYGLTLVLACVILTDKRMRSFLYFTAVALALIENALNGLLRLPLMDTPVNTFCQTQAFLKVSLGVSMFGHLIVTALVLPLLMPNNHKLLGRANTKKWRFLSAVLPICVGMAVAGSLLLLGALGVSSATSREYCWVAAGQSLWYGVLAFYGWLLLFVVVTICAAVTALKTAFEMKSRVHSLSQPAEMAEAEQQMKKTYNIKKETAWSNVPKSYKRMFWLPVFSAVIWVPPFVRRVLQWSGVTLSDWWRQLHVVCYYTFSLGLMATTFMNTQVLGRVLCERPPV
ncbi:hypothetical protein KIPB_004314 [Kipferlia bialata]|uniref:Uncharacterized protein n=1 Tax=Kipferlia bialata TaxID=797122 RepID=A0A9K3CTI8_9EUKA|nr:hypothetical protein KIPB_004314 [Kipferlia bialata]|eukprot:g4314.t1